MRHPEQQSTQFVHMSPGMTSHTKKRKKERRNNCLSCGFLFVDSYSKTVRRSNVLSFYTSIPKTLFTYDLEYEAF